MNFELPVVNNAPIPNSIAGLGWALLGLTLLPIPLGMIHEVYTAIKYDKVKREKDTPYYISLLKFVNKPSPEWHPARAEDCVGRYAKYNSKSDTSSLDLDKTRF